VVVFSGGIGKANLSGSFEEFSFLSPPFPLGPPDLFPPLIFKPFDSALILPLPTLYGLAMV